jgi:hypothetical protein
MTRLNQLACACAVIALSACSPKEETISAKPAAEIKGKPIARTPETNTATSTSTQALTVAANTSATQSSPPPQPSVLSPQSLTNSAPIEQINGYSKVGFDKLSGFHYVMPDEISETNKPPADQFPPAIKSLNEKPIALRGFMLPLKIDQGLVTEMLIMKDQSMCCFGSTPKINEWVSVKMAEKNGVKPVMDQPVTVFGKLKVGEMRENGYLVGIYEMAGDKMESD